MTNPGFMGQRSAQQASSSFTNSAGQHASQAYQSQVRHSLDAAHRANTGRRSGGGAIGVALSVLVIAVAAGIALLVLSQAAPDIFAYLMSWFDRTF